ncbi:MAG TPA: CPBP family intramembrane glutamic endopeptidase [Gemmatimonadaceae bacterium]
MTAVSRPLTQALSVRPTSYFGMSRAPRYSILFALPLLVAYEALAAMLARPGQGELRNGADAMLRSAFTAVAGPRGSTYFMAAVILLGIVLVIRDRRRTDAFKPMVFVGMLAESTALALAFGFVISLTTAKLLGSLHALSIGQIETMPWNTRLMLSLGAGLYEELFFRVLLVTGLAAGARVVLGFGQRAAVILAVLVGAVIFSAFHYIGPYGDPWELQSFTFRMLSGLAFSGLYVLRGFGITAWTHALYDAFLLLL